MKQPKHAITTGIAGFLLLFFLYHAAEYMIVFKNSATSFLLCQALFFIAAHIIGKMQFGDGLKSWGFVINKHTSADILKGLIIGILVYGITFSWALFSDAEKIITIPNTNTVFQMMGLFVFGNFFSSFSEDILTRAYVYKHFNKKLQPHLLILLSAVIYVLNHIYRLGNGIETYVYLFLLGVFFMLPLLQTQRIWVTGCIHWAGICTFYYTHEVIKTTSGKAILSPNYILSLVLIIAIVLYFIMNQKFWKQIKS